MDTLLKYVGGGWLLSAAGTFVANSDVQPGEEGGMKEWAITLVIAGVVAVAVYLIAKGRQTTTAALVLAVLAVVTFPAFWLGLMPILAAAALGVVAGGGQKPRDGKATAAMVLSGLAIVGFLVMIFIG